MSAESTMDGARLSAALVQWLSHETNGGLFVTDSQLQIRFWNRWMETHSGKSGEAVLGESICTLFPEIVDRGMAEHYRGALEGRVTVLSHGLHRFLLKFPPTDPELPYLEMPQSVRITPLIDNETIVGTVTALRDVSDQLTAEIELRSQIDAQRIARATAEKALRTKDEFLSTLSHELRTPLNAVLGWSRVLLDPRPVAPELLQRGLTVIERNATTQAKMIDDMLDMARIVGGRLRVDLRPVDIVSVVLGAIDLIVPSANAKHVAIRTTFDPGTPLVLGDTDRLQQIVWNLLSNSLKFTEAGGSIEVRLEAVADCARIVVQDTGSGISADLLPYIFERFHQGDSSSTRRHGGLGLGLALVRELVAAHGGSVRAQSAGENKGAVFTIDLPAASDGDRLAKTVEVSKIINEPSVLTGVHVLLVEDEADARELAATVLRTQGAHVTVVSQASEAVAALANASPNDLPHVLVSDIAMPREDGYQLIRKVRSLEPSRGGRIPAVAMTGYAAGSDVTRALAAGYQIHLSKPADPALFVATIAELAMADKT